MSTNAATQQTNNRKEGGVVFHTAEVLDAKREQKVALSNIGNDKRVLESEDAEFADKVNAACDIAVEATKSAYEKFREGTESLMASNKSSDAQEQLDSFEQPPDVRSIDEINYQHDTEPKDINKEVKGHNTMIENRIRAIESQKKASEEELKKQEFCTNKQQADSATSRLAEGFKSKVSAVHQQSHRATAGIHNHKANKEAEALYGKPTEF